MNSPCPQQTAHPHVFCTSPAHSSTVLNLQRFDLQYPKQVNYKSILKHTFQIRHVLPHTHTYINGKNYSDPFTLLSITSFYKCEFWLHKIYSYLDNDKNTCLVLSPSFFPGSTQMPSCSPPELGQLVPMHGGPAPAASLRAPHQHHRTASWHLLLECVSVLGSGMQLPRRELAQEQHMLTASWCSVVEEKLQGYLTLIYKYSFSYHRLFTQTTVTHILLISKVFWWPYSPNKTAIG